MKIEKFQLRGSNPVCAAAFQLLRGCAPAQLKGKIVTQRFPRWGNSNLHNILSHKEQYRHRKEQ
jgi:hypothetical protein